MADKQRKRKWLTTHALKEFINDITEEELQAEEIYTEANDIQQLKDSSNVKENEVKKTIQDNEVLKGSPVEKESVEQQSDIQFVQEEPNKVLEAYLRELETKNSSLKKELELERVRVSDKLTERDNHWHSKLSELADEKDDLQQQLKETQQELTELVDQMKEDKTQLKDSAEITRELEELKSKYKETLEAKQEAQQELEQLKAATTKVQEQAKLLEQIKKDYEELKKDYQQLHSNNQKNETMVSELLAENETFIEWIEERDKKIATYQQIEIEKNDLQEELQEYKKAIESNTATEDQNVLEEAQMDVEEQAPDEPISETEGKTENSDQLAVEKEALNSALFDAHEEIAKLEEKTSVLKQLEAEKERISDRLADAHLELSKMKEQKNSEESLELSQAKDQISELIEKNEQLKKEVVQSQQEIGEVLISAKKQANRTVEEAQAEAKHMISSAELELENISNRAKKILIEVSESRKSVLSIYDDLEFKVESLSNGTLLKEIKKKKQDQSLSDYFD